MDAYKSDTEGPRVRMAPVIILWMDPPNRRSVFLCFVATQRDLSSPTPTIEGGGGMGPPHPLPAFLGLFIYIYRA